LGLSVFSSGFGSSGLVGSLLQRLISVVFLLKFPAAKLGGALEHPVAGQGVATQVVLFHYIKPSLAIS